MIDQSQKSVSAIRLNVYNVLDAIKTIAGNVGRDLGSVRLVAATKTVSVNRLVEAYQAGIRIFGENRLQEAQDKMKTLGPREDLTWHFIGRLQRRKIKSVVGRFELIHSVENVEQARAIDRCAKDMGIHQAILLEVNIGNESSKGGFEADELLKRFPDMEALPHLSIQGLMTIPPLTKNPEQVRPYFRELRYLGQSLQASSVRRLQRMELSMGMSQDYPVAIEEGATLVRVGTALFGPRNVN